MKYGLLFLLTVYIVETVKEKEKDKQMKVINMTPHDIVVVSRENVEQDEKRQYIVDADKLVKIAVFPKSGILPRVTMQDKKVDEFDGVPLHQVAYGDIENLPKPQEGVLYCVSGLVASAGVKAGRKDLVAPGGLVRDRANPSVVLGCLFLQIQ